MSNIDGEETIGKILRQAYQPISLSPCVKEQIRERLLVEIEACSYGSRQLWVRPRLMVPILVSIASGLIAYGYWISITLW